jgi:hypothetical protein
VRGELSIDRYVVYAAARNAEPTPNTCEVRVKNELEHVRDWAKGEILDGRVPPSSWYQHVKLIEAADAILHDISVMANVARSGHRPERRLEGRGNGEPRGQKLHAIRGGRH